MKDRFKFRILNIKENRYEDLTRKDVIFSIAPNGALIRDIIYECTAENSKGGQCHCLFYPVDGIYKVEFCTGLKDKNGKLIFEGDILKGFAFNHQDDKEKEIKYIMKYMVTAEESQFYTSEITDIGNFECLLYISESEVIGNIYENPELLKDGE